MLFAAAVAVTEAAGARRPVQRGVPNAWRNVVSAAQTTAFELEGTRLDVGWHRGRDGYRASDPEGAVDDPDAGVWYELDRAPVASAGAAADGAAATRSI